MGFKFARQKGSHVTLKKGNIGCVFPLHSELDRGTLNEILKQAHVDKDEFMKYLIVFL